MSSIHTHKGQHTDSSQPHREHTVLSLWSASFSRIPCAHRKIHNPMITSTSPRTQTQRATTSSAPCDNDETTKRNIEHRMCQKEEKVAVLCAKKAHKHPPHMRPTPVGSSNTSNTAKLCQKSPECILCLYRIVFFLGALSVLFVIGIRIAEYGRFYLISCDTSHGVHITTYTQSNRTTHNHA